MIVFISLALNIHQIGVADALYHLANRNFWFIETGDTASINGKGGGENAFATRFYLIRTANGSTSVNAALQLIKDADVVIYGAAPLMYIKERIRAGKLTLLYSERWFKKGFINLFSPNLIKQMWFYHTQCYNKPLYLLSSSAYAFHDFNLMGAFKNKAFKWGYFTQCADLDIESLQKAKRNAFRTQILWCGRFIDWKHPEVMIKLAEKLREAGEKFQINMIGSGELQGSIRTMIQQKHLSDYINVLGSMPNVGVVEAMQTHHIACFTSDRNEGWGAVLNEAMGGGCCPVSSIETGATPYLIKDGINGYSFDLKKERDLFEKVLWLIQHPEEREKMSIEAYKTIREVWSPDNAAQNVYKLSEALLGHKDCNIEEGPCSKA